MENHPAGIFLFGWVWVLLWFGGVFWCVCLFGFFLLIRNSNTLFNIKAQIMHLEASLLLHASPYPRFAPTISSSRSKSITAICLLPAKVWQGTHHSSSQPAPAPPGNCCLSANICLLQPCQGSRQQAPLLDGLLVSTECQSELQIDLVFQVTICTRKQDL